MFKLDTNSYEYDYQISSAGNYENMQVLKRSPRIIKHKKEEIAKSEHMASNVF